MRVIAFKRPAGTEFKLVLGWCVVGRRLPGSREWSIRRLFRPFVDESSLNNRVLNC
jgi:hypothetical protein